MKKLLVILLAIAIPFFVIFMIKMIHYLTAYLFDLGNVIEPFAVYAFVAFFTVILESILFAIVTSDQQK